MECPKIDKRKKPAKGRFLAGCYSCFAEREGFEPPEAFTSTVFKTAAFDRSAISPRQMYGLRYFNQKNI